MSGGEVYVHDPKGVLGLRLNEDLVVAQPLRGFADDLRRLLERHVRYTGSARAQALLDRWEESVGEFWRVAPRSNVAALEDEHEGTLAGGPHAEEAAAAPVRAGK